MDSFQAKIGWNSLGNTENNNYRSVPFRSNPTSNRNSKKIAKKFKKNLKKYHYGLISSHNRVEKEEKEKR